MTSGSPSGMSTGSVAPAILKKLEPLGSLSADGMRELSRLCRVEHCRRNGDPFRLRGLQGQAVYLIKGELNIGYADESTEVIVGGTDAANIALGSRQPAVVQAKAITDVELIRIDEEMLDIILTWDQLAAPKAAAEQPARTETDATEGSIAPRMGDPCGTTDWRTMTGMFDAESLTRGAFAGLPPAHIETLLGRFRRMNAVRGQTVIREGDEGGSYYLIESGRCTVTRQVGGTTVELAELKAGDAFGEEALVVEAPRNASVTMKTDGTLLRLAKEDFIELLREPLLHRIPREEAEKRVAGGAVWLDVRFPAEYNVDKLPGAINIPLNEIRDLIGSLDRRREYIVYCQSGRRSSAAAFLLSQRGHKAWLLDGGLRGSPTA